MSDSQKPKPTPTPPAPKPEISSESIVTASISGADIAAGAITTGKLVEPVTVQPPSLGRIVHYSTTPAGASRAAIITRVHDYEEDLPVDLVVFNATGAVPIQDVHFSETPRAGHWNWPPRS